MPYMKSPATYAAQNGPRPEHPLGWPRIKRTAPYAALLAFMAVHALFVALAATMPTTAVAAPHAPATRVLCHEGQPCWEWSTMGNLDRGVYVRGGEGIVIVDASGYCHLRRAHLLDTARTPHLKGDRIARVHGCDVRYFAQPS